MTSGNIFAGALVLVTSYVGIVLFSVLTIRRIKRNIAKKELEVKRRMYELAIMKEISDRTGHSLNIQKVLDVISGSLNQFLEYSVSAYMLLGKDNILFKADVERSISSNFLQEVRERMIKSLEAITGRELKDVRMEETITGAVALEAMHDSVRSYFNIPLVIGGELAGILTIAHSKEELYQEEEMTILYKIVNQATRAVTKLEEVVRTEQGKISAMLESMVEGFLMTDLEHRVVVANPRIREIIGYQKEGMPTIFDVTHALKDVFSVQASLEEAIRLDTTISANDVPFNGYYYDILVTPVKSNVGSLKGQILGGVVIFHDVTQEKKAEKMQYDFTAMMVHELRSPLGNMKKIGELMKTEGFFDNKESAAEYVGMLYESSSSMLDLVNDLLDVSRMEAGIFDLDKKEGSVKQVVLDSHKRFDTMAQNGKMELRSYFGEGIPDSILIDSKRIAQVLNNFLANAVNFTPEGGKITIECFLHKKGALLDDEAAKLGIPWVPGDVRKITGDIPDSVVVAVTDTGEGIIPENIGKLFNKFTQFAPSVQQKDHKGTGLGLVVSKGIVVAHGGTIGLGSKPGVGSTFYMTIKL